MNTPATYYKPARTLKAGERFRMAPDAPTILAVRVRCLCDGQSVEVLWRHLHREGVDYLFFGVGEQVAVVVQN